MALVNEKIGDDIPYFWIFQMKIRNYLYKVDPLPLSLHLLFIGMTNKMNERNSIGKVELFMAFKLKAYRGDSLVRVRTVRSLSLRNEVLQ